MTEDDTIGKWVLGPEKNRLLRLEMIQKCRVQGRDRDVILEAEELLDSDPKCSEALFFLGEASLQVGDAEGALEAFEQHVAITGDMSVAVEIGISMAHFDRCDFLTAEKGIRNVLQRAPHEAQGHFVLGLILEISGTGMRESTAAFMAANQLEPDRYPFPLILEKEEWKQCIELALQQIPKTIREFWDGLPVHLFESPDIGELTAGELTVSPRVFGLFIGTPEPDKRPEGLRLFTRNLSRSRTRREVVSRIAATLEEEALDWMGHSPPGMTR